MKNEEMQLQEFSEYFMMIDEGLKDSITLYKAINLIWQEKMRVLSHYNNVKIDTKDLFYLSARLIDKVSELTENVDLMINSISANDPYNCLDRVSKIKNENSKEN